MNQPQGEPGPAAWDTEREQRFSWLINQSLTGFLTTAESRELSLLKTARDTAIANGCDPGRVRNHFGSLTQPSDDFCTAGDCPCHDDLNYAYRYRQNLAATEQARRRQLRWLYLGVGIMTAFMLAVVGLTIAGVIQGSPPSCHVSGPVYASTRPHAQIGTWDVTLSPGQKAVMPDGRTASCTASAQLIVSAGN